MGANFEFQGYIFSLIVYVSCDIRGKNTTLRQINVNT